MKLLKSLFLTFALTYAPIAGAQETILGFDGEESTGVGIYIKEIATDEILVDHNSQMALTPASVMKAVTAATALSVRGADGRFHTPVLLKGAKGQNGTWKGNL
ncbi:MAG: D-alanyl-D-alanine carboxypeptidase, partial [Muribaculaceae bacterium]|nr:D-alanyl-D-alanine carboxypeptidase [Muribaculaceae bacterium]